MDRATEAEKIQRKFTKRYPLIDWRVGWNGPEMLMIRAQLSINDPAELEEPRILRQVQMVDALMWETATVDMHEMIAQNTAREMARAILEWKHGD